MLRKEKKLDEIISNMKSLGEMLVPYNYPQSTAALFEDDLDIFKERELVIDGYNVIIHYQKSDYNDHILKTLQVYNKIGPFLPFNIVVKLGLRFLGGNNLSLVEIFRNNRKIYCWSLPTDEYDNPIDSPYEVDGENCMFEGFKYVYINSSKVSFY
jgi:hypothetical protein